MHLLVFLEKVVRFYAYNSLALLLEFYWLTLALPALRNCHVTSSRHGVKGKFVISRFLERILVNFNVFHKTFIRTMLSSFEADITISCSWHVLYTLVDCRINIRNSIPLFVVWATKIIDYGNLIGKKLYFS